MKGKKVCCAFNLVKGSHPSGQKNLGVGRQVTRRNVG